MRHTEYETHEACMMTVKERVKTRRRAFPFAAGTEAPHMEAYTFMQGFKNSCPYDLRGHTQHLYNLMRDIRWIVARRTNLQFA